MSHMNISLRRLMIYNRYSHFNGSVLKRITYNRNFSATQNNAQYFCLFYDYVDNILEKRKPVRSAHLDHISKYVNDDRCKLGGAFGDNFDGALIVFHCKDSSEVEDFVKNDPYVLNGLVTAWKIRPWVVVGGAVYDK